MCIAIVSQVHKFWYQSYLSNQAVFSIWPSSQHKNLKMKLKAFKIKLKRNAIIFIGLSLKQIKQFLLEGKSPTLKHTLG